MMMKPVKIAILGEIWWVPTTTKDRILDNNCTQHIIKPNLQTNSVIANFEVF